MSCSIAFLLGAGFSSPFGVPTMHPFLHSFRLLARQKYHNLYGTLGRHLEGLDDDSDIEGLLSSLGKAERLLEAIPHGEVLSETLCRWQQESRFLKSHLISYIIEQCERFDRELAKQIVSPGLTHMDRHASLDTVHIFTTNYDRVLEHACDVSGVKFSDGFGDIDKELVAPWTRNYEGKLRIYKLHGSVSYYVDQKTDGIPLFLRLDRGYPLPGPDFRLSRGGNDLEPIMVLPTLEKDTLGEPYSYLNHLFTETMSHTLLVVAVGTSLRDNHIVSAINYNAKNVILLLVDTEPTTVAHRISDIPSVKLRSDAKYFFEHSIFGLCEIISSCIGKQRDEVYAALDEFSRNESMRMSLASSLTTEQQDALDCVLASQDCGDVLDALYRLRGLDEDRVVQAISNKYEQSSPTDIRKAVAACLGHSSNPAVVTALSTIARDDPSPDVRLESYLALSEIHTEVAVRALDTARERWPNDSFFLS